MGSCYYKKIFGIECPGCGMQRSTIHLLKGEFIESFKMFPALIPVIIMLLVLIAHLIFKFKNGHKVLLHLFILNAALMVSNYIFKLVI